MEYDGKSKNIKYQLVFVAVQDGMRKEVGAYDEYQAGDNRQYNGNPESCTDKLVVFLGRTGMFGRILRYAGIDASGRDTQQDCAEIIELAQKSNGVCANAGNYLVADKTGQHFDKCGDGIEERYLYQICREYFLNALHVVGLIVVLFTIIQYIPIPFRRGAL